MRKFWILSLLVLLTGPLLANEKTPEEIVRTNAERIFTLFAKHAEESKTNPQIIREIVETVLTPIIDFESMAKLTLAKHWRTASKERRKRFISAYKTTLIRAYSRTLNKYSAGSTIRILPVRAEDRSKRATVHSIIYVNNDKEPTNILYKLRLRKDKKGGKEWLIYDLEIEGLSLIKNFRTFYGQEISHTSLEQLIQRLEQENKAANFS